MSSKEFLKRIGWKEQWKDGDFSTVKRASSLNVFTVGLLLALSRVFNPALLLEFLQHLLPEGTTLLLDNQQLRKVYIDPLKIKKEKLSKSKGKLGDGELKKFLEGFFLKEQHFSLVAETTSSVSTSPAVPSCPSCAEEINSLRAQVSSLQSELSAAKLLLEKEKAETRKLAELLSKRDEEFSAEISKSRELSEQARNRDEEISTLNKKLAGFNSGIARRKMAIAKKRTPQYPKVRKHPTYRAAKTTVNITLAPVIKNVFKGSIGGFGSKPSLYVRLPVHRKLNSQVSPKEIYRRTCDALSVLKMISGGSAVGELSESELEFLFLSIAKKHSPIFRNIAKSVGVDFIRKMSPEEGVHLKSLLRLPMSSFRSLRTIFSNMGYDFLPSEPNMRLVQKEMEGFMDKDHTDVKDEYMVISSDKKKEEKKMAYVPVIRCKDLEAYVRAVYAEKKKQLQEKFGHEALEDILPSTIKINWSTDGGARIVKYLFELMNLGSAGSPFDVNPYAMHEGAECYDNMAKVFDYYLPTLLKMQREDYFIDGRRVEFYLGGDLKFQDAVLGKQGSSATYPCAQCMVTREHLQKHPKKPHTPQQCGAKCLERDNEDYFGNFLNNLADDRKKGDRAKKGKFHGSVVGKALFPLKYLFRLVPPILHIMLGIVLRLFVMVENKTIEFDKRDVDPAVKAAQEEKLRGFNEELISEETKLKQQALDLIDNFNLRERITSVLSGDGDEVDAIATHQTVNKKTAKDNDKCKSLLCLISTFDEEIDWIKCSKCSKWMHSLCEVLATPAELSLAKSRAAYVCLKCSDESISNLISLVDDKIESLKSDQVQTESRARNLRDHIWELQNDIENEMGPLQSRLISILSEIKVDRQAYHGKSFVGNHCKLILKHHEKICSVLKQDPGLHRKFLDIFKCFADVQPLLFRKSYLEEAEIERATALCIRFGELYPVSFPNETITRKMHVLIFHVPPFLAREKTLGLFSEEECESIHNLINQELRPLQCVRNRAEKLSLVLRRFTVRQKADRNLLVPVRRVCQQCKDNGVRSYFKSGVCPECGSEQQIPS